MGEKREKMKRMYCKTISVMSKLDNKMHRWVLLLTTAFALVGRQDGEYLDEVIANSKKNIREPMRLPNTSYFVNILGTRIETMVVDAKVRGMSSVRRIGKANFVPTESGIDVALTLGIDKLSVDGKFLIRRLLPLLQINVDAIVQLHNVRTNIQMITDFGDGGTRVRAVHVEPIESITLRVKNWGVLNPLASAVGEAVAMTQRDRVRSAIAKTVRKMMKNILRKMARQ